MDAPVVKLPRHKIRLILAALAATAVLVTGTIVTSTATADTVEAKAKPQGVDVSHYQGNISWKKARNAGVQFAWIKATEGSTYTDPKFARNYNNAYKAKVIRGAYHFARPGNSGGAKQARYFLKQGGGWSADGRTLPGALDLEAGCHGLSKKQMRSWISSFNKTYKAKTGRHVAIYTTASWWKSCTGGWKGMSKSAMWVAHWKVSKPTVPAGWSKWTAWQYTSTGSVKGIAGDVDRNKFNGSRAKLKAYAKG